jgi:hypothetical protein
LDEEVAKFWRAFEADTGERVEAKAVGELCEGTGETGVWFLLILTDKAFWFKHVPSDNWLASLFRPRTFTLSPKGEPDLTVIIPRGDLVSLEEPEPRRRGWFSRPVFPRLTLSWREEGLVRRRTFSVDPTSDLLPRLRSCFKG